MDDPERDYASTIYVLSNQGGRRFAEPAPIYAPDDEWVGSFALVDVDRDGDLDVAAVTIEGAVGVYLNRGNGRFEPPVMPGMGFVMDMEFADLDGDGDHDVIGLDRDAGPADMGGYVVRVGMNQGGGRFGSATALYDF